MGLLEKENEIENKLIVQDELILIKFWKKAKIIKLDHKSIKPNRYYSGIFELLNSSLCPYL